MAAVRPSIAALQSQSKDGTPTRYGSFDGSRSSSPAPIPPWKAEETDRFETTAPIPRTRGSNAARNASLNREWTRSTEAVVYKSHRKSGYELEADDDQELARGSEILYPALGGSDDGDEPRGKGLIARLFQSG